MQSRKQVVAARIRPRALAGIAAALGIAGVVLASAGSAGAAGVTATLNGSTVKVTGDDAPNLVTVLQYDGFDTLYVIDDQSQQTILSTVSSAVARISIDLKGGNDVLVYRPAHFDDFLYGKKVRINLGDGDDIATLPFHTYMNDQIVVHGALDIQVKGGNGDDYVNAQFGDKPGGKLVFKADLGNGDDQGYADMWGEITSLATVKFDLRGGAGNDQVQTYSTYVNGQGYNRVDVAAGSTLDIKIRGGSGNDQSYNVYGGDADGKVSIRVDLGTGADGSTIDAQLPQFSFGSFTGYVNGRGGNDVLEGILQSQAIGASAHIVLNGGPSMDTCTATGGVTKLGCEQ
jgi:hypothetical protein